jgi:beta-glucosidase
MGFNSPGYDSTDIQLSKPTIGTNDNFNVTVTVHNTGSFDGKEVVQVGRGLIEYPPSHSVRMQVYVTDVVSSVVTPNQFLVGFQKVDIPCVSLSHRLKLSLVSDLT